MQSEPYIEDTLNDGYYYGHIIPSTLPKGAVSDIRLPDLPSDTTVVSEQNLPGSLTVKINDAELPLLGGQEILFAGQPVVLLAGPSRRTLRKVAGNVRIDYESNFVIDSFTSPDTHQISKERVITNGSPDKAFENAFQVIEGRYRVSAGNPTVFPPALAVPGKKLTIYSPSPWPEELKTLAAAALKRKSDDLLVIKRNAYPSPPMGVWFSVLTAIYAAILAEASGKPVYLPPYDPGKVKGQERRSPTAVYRRTAVDKDGNILGETIDIKMDTGAFDLLSPDMLDRICISAAGAYTAKHTRISAKSIRTSSVPADFTRGLERAAGFFSSETHTSRIAGIAQTDPYSWRLNHILKKNTSFITGGILKTDSPAERLLTRVVELSDYRRKYASFEMLKKRRRNLYASMAPLRGIGLSLAYQGNGFQGRRERQIPASVCIKLDSAGELTIATQAAASAGPMGRLWKDQAGDILGIDADSISLEGGPEAPDSGPDIYSRPLTVITPLIQKTSQALQRLRFRDPLPISVTRKSTLPRGFQWDEETFSGIPFTSISWGAAVVEVELDPVSLESRLRGIWVALDCGALLDPDHARSIVERGIRTSLQHTISDMRFWQGSLRLTTSKLSMSSFLRIDFSNDEKKDPGGLHQLPYNLIPAAYIDAISQATGAYFDRIPVPPEIIQQYQEEIS